MRSINNLHVWDDVEDLMMIRGTSILFFFMEKDKANERSGHLMVSDYRRPRPRATPEELQVRCLPLRWVGRRSPALPDAKRSGIKPQLHAGFKCRGW